MSTVLSQPLSQSLSLILAGMGAKDRLTLNELIQRTELRGVYLLMVLLSLPFISPIPLPGLSNVVGLVVVILAIQIVRGADAAPAQVHRRFGSFTQADGGRLASEHKVT